MKIGELSEQTGVPTRMLRYYEQQGLLEAARSANGYRSYGEDDIDRVVRVRGLIQAGLTTRMARVVLDIERQSELGLPSECSAELAAQLTAELKALDERLSCLSRSRDAVATFLARARDSAPLPSAG